MAERKNVKALVRCVDCHNANLMRYGNDPLIAECRFGGIRNVASTPRVCGKFREHMGPVTLARRT